MPSLLATDGARPELGEEGYELTVSMVNVYLRAPHAHGLFNGVQTIRQLLTPSVNNALPPIPCVHIVDKPAYGWRGSLLDCGRHFMTKEFVKRYIDLLAYHKMNVLHWHLTEDQGWRIEIKKYPKLTEIGAWREATRDSEQPRDAQGRYGGFYTQDDRCAKIVAYAAEPVSSRSCRKSSCRGTRWRPRSPRIRNCPVPAGRSRSTRVWGVHSLRSTARATSVSIEFNSRTCLTEVHGTVPVRSSSTSAATSVPRTRWKECPKCQTRIKTEGLAKMSTSCRATSMRRTSSSFSTQHGRRLIGWDEILEGGLAA